MFQRINDVHRIKMQEQPDNKYVFYIGMNDNMDIKAIPMMNTFVTGLVGSGKSVFLNNFIKNIIEYNPGDSIDISIWDGMSYECSIWFPKKNGEYSTERYIPHIKDVVYNNEFDKETNDTVKAGLAKLGSRSEFISTIRKEVQTRLTYLEDMYECHDYDTYLNYHYDNLHITPHVVIFDEYQVTNDEDDELVELLKVCESAGVYIVLLSQNVPNALHLVPYCGNRITLRSTGSLYSQVLGEEYKDAWLPQYGYCYYKHARSKTEPEMIKIPFHTRSFLVKFVGSYSIRR